MYICLEGMDGCGKSTVSRLIQEKLGEDKCVLVPFPSHENFGGVIRANLRGEVSAARKSLLFAFAADGIDISERIIEPARRAGKVIISDRHPLISALVYQMGDDHSWDVINHVRSLAGVSGTSDPSFLVYLDVTPEVALERMRARQKYVDAVYEPTTLEQIREHRRAYHRAYEHTRGILWENNGSADEAAEALIDRFHLRSRLGL